LLEALKSKPETMAPAWWSKLRKEIRTEASSRKPPRSWVPPEIAIRANPRITALATSRALSPLGEIRPARRNLEKAGSMSRNILGVVAGYALIGLFVVLSDALAAALFPGLTTQTPPSIKYLAAVLFYDSIYTVIGGYVCARIAQAGARGATIGLIAFGEIMGVISAVVSWRIQPHWFAITLLILYPPLIWLAYALSPVRRPAEAGEGREAGAGADQWLAARLYGYKRRLLDDSIQSL
jgi:hypothetical protein